MDSMVNERSTPQQERSRVAFTRVLNAADELFAEFGVHETQISQIIDRSGVSAGSLYRFFPDKMSVAHALIERYRGGIGGMAGVLVRAETVEEVLNLIDATVDLSAKYRAENPGYRALSEVFPASDPASPLYEMRQEQVELFVELVADVASHISKKQRHRIISYMAVIMDAVLKAEDVESDSEARATETKQVLRRYVEAELLSGA